MSGISGRTAGTVAGALVGAVVGYFVPPLGIPTGLAVGSAVGSLAAAEGVALQVALLARSSMPPGVKGVVRPLLGLPFKIGGDLDPDGALDCWGCVCHVLREARGVEIPRDAQGHVELFPTCALTWQAPMGGDWRTIVRPFDILVSFDARSSQHLAQEYPELGLSWFLHTSLVVGEGLVLSSFIDRGVLLTTADDIAQRLNVTSVLRPPLSDGQIWRDGKLDRLFHHTGTHRRGHQRSLPLMGAI